MQRPQRIRVDLGGKVAFIKKQAGGARLRDNPLTRGVGEAMLVVAASHVTMDARKPYLLHHLVRLRLQGPDARRKRPSPLVYRKRLISVSHDLAQLNVVEEVSLRGQPAQPLERDPQRAYCVPHTNELHVNVSRVGPPKFLRRRGIRVSSGPSITVKTQRFHEPIGVALSQES